MATIRKSPSRKDGSMLEPETRKAVRRFLAAIHVASSRHATATMSVSLSVGLVL
jgi:hypothetical protein